MSQIKELQPKEGVTLLAIKTEGVPKNPHFYTVGDKMFLVYFIKNGDGWKQINVELPPSLYKILGISTEIPESVWQGIVKKAVYLDAYSHSSPIPCYKGYVDNVWKWTATESAMSLLEKHEVYSVNPYSGIWPRSLDSPPCSLAIQDHMRKLFLTAKAKTGTHLILQQIKS